MLDNRDPAASRATIIGIGLVSAVLYSMLLPLWEGWDEPYHYGLVQWVGIQMSLPDTSRAVLSEEVRQSILLAPASPATKERHPEVRSYSEFQSLPQAEQLRLRRELDGLSPALQYQFGTGIVNYEAQHAPLTYILLAVPDRLMARLSLTTRVLILRLLIALFTVVITALGTLRLGEVLEIPEPFVLAALSVVLLTQVFLATICRVSNDWLAVALVPWMFVSAITLLRLPSVREAVRLGTLLAAGLLTKAYFLAFAGPVFAVVGLAWLRRDLSLRRVAAFVAPLLIAAPWYVRNVVRYGTISGYGASLWKRTPADILPAMREIPWLTDLPGFGRQALWGASNSGMVFSRATLNFALILLLAAAALTGWQLRKSANREAPLVLLSGSFVYLAALAYAICDHYVITKGAFRALMPWYCPPLFPPLAILLLWGLSRSGAAGRWLSIGLLAVWTYVFACTWFIKLIPIYAGYPFGSSKLSLLVPWYSSSWREAHAMLRNTALGSVWLIYPLACLVVVFACAVVGRQAGELTGWRIAGRSPRSAARSSAM